MAKKDNSYLNNPNLKRVGTPIEFTREQVEQYIKCVNDPVYFANNYIKIVHVDRGLVQLQLYDYQRNLLENFHGNRETIVKMPRQCGKCVTGDTKIMLRNKKTGDIVETQIGELFWTTKLSK